MKPKLTIIGLLAAFILLSLLVIQQCNGQNKLGFGFAGGANSVATARYQKDNIGVSGSFKENRGTIDLQWRNETDQVPGLFLDYGLGIAIENDAVVEQLISTHPTEQWVWVPDKKKKPKRGRWEWKPGDPIAVLLQSGSSQMRTSIRLPVGMGYAPTSVPIEISGTLSPEFAPGRDWASSWDWQVAVRYFLNF